MKLIIEPIELEASLSQSHLGIIDICQTNTYAQGHIPGAVHVNPAELVCGIKPATGMLPSPSELTRLFSRIAYDPSLHYVVYDDEGGGWAGRFIWTLDVIGHKHYSYLNGGLHAWAREGHPLSTQQNLPQPEDITLTLNNDVIAELETVLESLNNPNIKIWDARSAAEYRGEKVFSQRGGHIPGALNLDWLETMDKKRNLRLHSLDKLRDMLSFIGINQGNEIITHCQTHHRSGLTYLVAKALGFKVKAYHGSWAQWGNNPEVPIET